jgi:hypothetical protein
VAAALGIIADGEHEKALTAQESNDCRAKICQIHWFVFITSAAKVCLNLTAQLFFQCRAIGLATAFDQFGVTCSTSNL